MQERTQIQKALLRRALRKQMQRSSSREESLYQLALDDEAVFETVYETAMGNAMHFGNATGSFDVTNSDGYPVVDNLLKLLQWFVTNSPQLLEVIRLIVDLFGSLDTATDACDAETLFIE